MYYLKKTLYFMLLFLSYCLMLKWEGGNYLQLRDSKFSFFLIDGLLHLEVGLCLGGLLCSGKEFNISKAINITVFTILFLLTIGYGWNLLGLNIQRYYLSGFVYKFAPFFQIILGAWIFVNVRYLILKAKKSKECIEAIHKEDQ